MNVKNSISLHLNDNGNESACSTQYIYRKWTDLKRPVVGWCIGPAKRLAAAAVCGVKYAAKGGKALLLLGLFANFTVIGSVRPFGIVPFNSLIAFSASWRWSKRMKPTPLDKPVREFLS